MSQRKRFATSLIPYYRLVAVTIEYTLASLALALNDRSKEQFGLWALVTHICNVNTLLITLGMPGAVARVSIDGEADCSSTKYGSVSLLSFSCS